MRSATDVLWLLAGLLVVGVTLAEVIGTLMVTVGKGGRLRPTGVFYRVTWAAWSSVARRVSSAERREGMLALYAPLSLLALLALWLLGLLVGWSLVWVAFQSELQGDRGYASLLYYSGVVLLTLGFGDITPVATGPRLLALLEATTGLATVALVISYLPALYSAYGRREAKLLTLDHPSGERIMPVSLVVLHAPDGDLQHLYDFFESWEPWVADVLESHTSYPMLALFRAQHRGQSWVTGLGVVLDAAVLVCACVPGAETREPGFLYRRGHRAVAEISSRLCRGVEAEARTDRDRFGWAFERLEQIRIDLYPVEEAWERLVKYRETYAHRLQALFDYVVAPPGFWGHSAGDELGEPETPFDPPDPAVPDDP